MISFQGGPAEGKAEGLLLRRAPRFLRVVRGGDGDWDALDQLGDAPAAGETIYAYERVGRRWATGQTSSRPPIV